MNECELRPRRATLEDLERLRAHWTASGAFSLELEKRLTHFQILEDSAGQIVASVGLHLDRQQGKIHHETLPSSDLREQAHQLLWARLQSVAKNNGLIRLWVEEAATGWEQHGFSAPLPAQLEKLPPAFGSPQEKWRVLQLKEETGPAVSLEHEFDLFAQAQKESSDRLIEQARKLKKVAYLILAFFLIVIVILTIIAMRKVPLPFGR